MQRSKPGLIGRWGPILVLSLLLQLASPVALATASDSCTWPDWESFRHNFINDGGRVVDPAAQHSTSEGQSYGLFFALVANDQASFERILRWTEDNLAHGDLTARLPAWQWGSNPAGQWGVLDDNAASDADLWIAYSLAEAGRLWQKPRYSALAELLAQRILREESALLPGLGQSLLPGPRGFASPAGMWRLNPSYLPIQLLRRMAFLYPKSEWKKLLTPAFETVVRSAPKGFAPEWIRYKADNGFQADSESQGEGSYNAIRVYLWAGMLADDEPLRAVLLKTLAPMVQTLSRQGIPPEKIDTRQGTVQGNGPAGFSAALLPFLASTKQAEALHQQQLRLTAKAPLQRRDNYYEQALTLFGQGWLDGRYRFARDGALLPRWTCSAN